MSAAAPLFILGPTAVGKSVVAAEVAARIGGEIVGADAFQIYRGLDVLTAKPGTGVLGRVPHHLIGEIALTESFDVERFRRLAEERLAQIAGRGREAVVAGGTGLYVRALTRGLADLPPADAALRAELSARPLADLQAQFRALDPEGAARIDLQNPRRVVRAVEVCLLTGQPFSSFREEWAASTPIRGVLLTREREALCGRIAQRTDEMFAAGVVEEVRAVGEISATAAQAIGFRDIRAMLTGEISEVECRERIAVQTRQYAKRQLTWFRREPGLRVIEIAESESAVTTAERVLAALT